MTSTTGTPDGGFTLVEILLAVVLLGIGSIMIQENFLRSAGIVSESADRLRIQSRLDEELWRAREGLLYSDAPSAGADDGAFAVSGRRYAWSSQTQASGTGSDIYVVRASGRRAESQQAKETVCETLVSVPVPSL